MSNVKLAIGYANFAQRVLPKVSVWGAPAVLFAGWMVFPTLNDDFRTSLGLPAASMKTYPIAKWVTEEVDKPPTRK